MSFFPLKSLLLVRTFVLYSVANQKGGSGGGGYREGRKKERRGEGKGKAEAWKLKVKYLINADICGYKHKNDIAYELSCRKCWEASLHLREVRHASLGSSGLRFIEDTMFCTSVSPATSTDSGVQKALNIKTYRLSVSRRFWCTLSTATQVCKALPCSRDALETHL